MRTKIGLFAIVLLSFQGCIIHSLYPLYTEDVLIEDKNLEGFWAFSEAKENAECPDGLSFEKLEKKNKYSMTICNEGHWSRLDVYLVKIGKYTYIDFYPDRDFEMEKKEEPSYYDFHLIPVHSFARINISAKELSIESFDTDWLENLFKQRKIRIKHEMVEEEILLTAPSKDLQKFVLKYAEDKNAFNDADVYVKK